MQITVKVDLAGAKDPAAAVRAALKALRPDLAASAKVEEVFPGVRSGSRAGMVVVRLNHELTTREYDALLRALRARAEVTYAEPAAPRKSRNS